MVDFEVTDHGSIVQVHAKTQEAKDWIDENVEAPAYMWSGEVLNIEHRFADDIINGMLNAGLEGE